MSRTVTALYDTRAEAEAARQRLSSAVDVERARIIDNDANSSGRGLNNLYMSNEDRHAYGEGIRRGGFMLCAEVDGDEDADKIIAILEQTPSVDLDDRQETWKREGWAPYSPSTAGTRQGFSASGTPQTGSFQGGTAAASGNVVQEEHVPIIEEELRVGKRQVERGGARVRSYVREVPVHEQVTLREEHVQVERRPVDQPVASGTVASGANADLLQERDIEMRETAEEAVVQKVANVREEVVVTKTAEQRTEQIDDTVRRTEVEVDEGARASGDRSAFGGFGGDRDSSGSASQDTAGTNFDRNDRR